MRSSVAAAAVGVVAGLAAMLALGAVRGWNEPEQIVVAPTTTSAAGVEAPAVTYVAANETQVGQAVLIPEGIEMDGDAAVFSYRLETIAPLGEIEVGYIALNPQDPGTPIDPASLPPVYPAEWSLSTPSGNIAGETATVTSRSVRFDVPASFSPSQVTGLRLESYRVPVPVNEIFVISEAEPTYDVAPGVALSLLSVVDQGGQTILQVEVVSAEPFNRENLTVEGVGSVWASAVREAEGRPRYNLRLVIDGPPENFVLRVRGIVWLTVEDPRDIALDGL